MITNLSKGAFSSEKSFFFRVQIVWCIALFTSCANIKSVPRTVAYYEHEGSTYTFLDSTALYLAVKKTPKPIIDSVWIAESEIPKKSVADFQSASYYAIKAIYSQDFQDSLLSFMRTLDKNQEYEYAWQGLNTLEIIRNMRIAVNGQFVDTYGGIKGKWLSVFYGNIAYDGSTTGPILMNRVPMKKRSVAQISGTIAHEVAHRIGLKHPHSNDNMTIAKNEPPYIIGRIVESIVAGYVKADSNNR